MLHRWGRKTNFINFAAVWLFSKSPVTRLLFSYRNFLINHNPTQTMMIIRTRPLKIRNIGVINFMKKKMRTIIATEAAIPINILPAVLTTPKVMSSLYPAR